MVLTAKTVNQIITQIYGEKDLSECASHYASNHVFGCSSYGADIIQEMMLSLLEMPSVKLINLYKSGLLKYYVIGGIRNMSISTQSKFYRKNGFRMPYKKKYEEKVLRDDVREFKLSMDSFYKRAQEHLNKAVRDPKKKYILDFVFFHHYELNLSGHSISKLTGYKKGGKSGVCPSTVYNYIKQIKNIIKEKENEY